MADNGSFWIEESNGQPFSGFKRKDRPKKMKYVGWASVPLYGFLEHIGKDTSNQLSQYDVTSIIDRYAKERGLFHPTKKKRIVCDEWLVSLFGRKTISKNKIHDLLDLHLAENQVVSDDDSSFGSEEDDIMHGPQNLPNSERKSNPKRKISEIPKSGFASIVPDNIKLVYLRRSLVQDLRKDPEKFETKVVGSFVRIKSDPNDYLRKNFYMLAQVTGVRRVSRKEDDDTEIILQVANFGKDVYISMLSDNKFLEEECEDLHQSVKQGLLKRPAVAEFEEKARLLHEDVTKHWIVTELDFLQKLIDRANEKGWRKEIPYQFEKCPEAMELSSEACTLLEYLDRKQLLQTPDEQARLLHEVPEVIEDEIEVETDGQDFPENTNEANHGSTRISPHRASDSPVLDIAASGTSSNNRQSNFADEAKRRPVEIQSLTAGATYPTNGATHPTDGETHWVDEKKNAEDQIGFRAKRRLVETQSPTAGATPPTYGATFPTDGEARHVDEKKNAEDQIGFQAKRQLVETQSPTTGATCPTNGETCQVDEKKDAEDQIGFQAKRRLLETQIPNAGATHLTDGATHLVGEKKNAAEDQIGFQAKLVETQIPTAGATHPTNGAILPTNGDGETHLVDAKKNDKDHYVVIDLSDDHTVDDEKKNTKDQIGSQVIDLSDDDDENMDHQNNGDLTPGIYIWYYVDPHGRIQGPFSISALKRWKEADYFPPDFKVWKTGQSQEEAVLLSEVICQQCESPS